MGVFAGVDDGIWDWIGKCMPALAICLDGEVFVGISDVSCCH